MSFYFSQRHLLPHALFHAFVDQGIYTYSYEKIEFFTYRQSVACLILLLFFVPKADSQTVNIKDHLIAHAPSDGDDDSSLKIIRGSEQDRYHSFTCEDINEAIEAVRTFCTHFSFEFSAGDEDYLQRGIPRREQCRLILIERPIFQG